MDYIPQLIIYVTIAAITPGPNNTIAFYTSYNFGIKNSIHLPSSLSLTNKEISYIVNKLNNFFNK